jgi:uridine monophosphate synthetase
MESFFTFLEKRVADSSSLLCIGLDPHVSNLPSPNAAGALSYCLNLVKKTAPYAAAFKPNAAFFEQFGAPGWEVLKAVIDAVREQSHRLGSLIPVILDAKRGDIASTAVAYAKSAFATLGAHAVTLSPYLGRDSIDPFLTDREKGVFLLCKTSNPGAGDLQDLPVLEADPDANQGNRVVQSPAGTAQTVQPLYLVVARLAQSWNAAGNIGLVVGATQPEALARVRAAAPDLWFLAPGVGAQGGDLEAALQAGLRADGRGMLLAVSRGIAHAVDPAMAAAKLRDEIINIKYRREHG